MKQRRRKSRAAEILAVIGIIAFLFQTFPFPQQSASPPAAPVSPTPNVVRPDSSPTVNLNLSYGPFSPAAQVKTSLLGVNIRADSALPNAALINATSTTYWRYPGGSIAERFNYSTNKINSDSGVLSNAINTIQNFLNVCNQTACNAILQLPAEINSSATAAFYVHYVETNLSFHPAYWEIGNEPATWTHFGIPWGSWAPSDSTNTTPFPFAYLVHKYATAIRAVDPSAQLIALGGTGQGSSNNVPWVKQLASFDGGLLAGISIHSYVGGNGPVTPTLQSFYNELKGTYSLPNLLPSMRAARTAACANCTGVGIFVSELGSANNASTYSTSGLLATFPNAVFMAAEMTQAINFNLTNEDYFAYANSYSGSWVFGGVVTTPTYYLFKDVIPNLGPTAYKANVTGPHNTLYAAGGFSSSTCTSQLLLVNTNLTTTYNVILTGSGFPTTGTGRISVWTGGTQEPVVGPWTTLTAFGVGPQVIALITETGCGAGGKGVLTASWNVLCQSGVGAGSCTPNPIRNVKAGAAWDAADNYTVLFGGTTSSGAAINQTWIWNNSGWTNFVLSPAPEARANITLVYDAADGYVMTWGGYAGTSTTFRNNTWSYLGGVWTSRITNNQCTHPSTTHCPSTRGGYAMVYVPLVGGFGGYVLMFGGNTGGTKFLSDTWKYSAGVWTNITASAGTAPTSRSEAGIAYDSVDNYVVMFGGLTATGPINDTREFNPVTQQWTTLYANGSTSLHAGPKARFDPQMSMDSNDGAVFLFSGSTGGLGSLTSQKVMGTKETWYFFAGNWTNDSTYINKITAQAKNQVPLPTYGAVFIDQPIWHYVLMEGGKTAQGTQNGTQQLGTLFQATVATNLGEVIQGSTLRLWANATNGSKPYNFNWTLPAGCTSSNVATLLCAPTATGFVTVSVAVTDQVGNEATAGPIRIWVDSITSATATFSVPTTNPVFSPSTFWALDYRCAPENNASCINFVHQTPAHWFRVAGSMEGYNATTGKEYSRFGGTTTINWNWTNIISFCAQVHPCNTVAAVPTQINYTATSVADVAYVEVNYSFHPTMWSLGNEPQGWVNFNHPFSATPLPQPYTRLTQGNAYQVAIVEAKVANAIRAYDPTIQVIAIQSAQCSNNLFNTQTALYLHAIGNPVIACHAYPGGQSTAAGTTYGFLSQGNVTRPWLAVNQQRNYLASTCTGCNLPIWITELNGANSGGTYQNYLTTWPGVAFWGAAFVQSMDINLSQMEYFELSCGGNVFALLGAGCTPTPVSHLYTNIFDHVRMNETFNVTTSSPARGLFAVYGKNASGTGSSLFFTNTNTSVAQAISTLGSFPIDKGVTVYSGSQFIGWKEVNYTAGHVPTLWTIPPEGVLLINSGSVGGNSGVSPSAPINLHVCGTGPTNTTVCWINPPGNTVTSTTVTSYYLTNKGCNYSVPVNVQTVNGSVWSVGIAGLTLGRQYCFVVALGNGSASSGISNTAKGAPGAPYGLYAITETQNSIAVGWGNPYGFSLLNDTVYVGLTCGVWQRAISTQGVATGFNITALGQGTRYCIEVQVWDGASNLSASLNDTTQGPPPIAQGTPPSGGNSGPPGGTTPQPTSQPLVGGSCSEIPVIGCSASLAAAFGFFALGGLLLLMGKRTEISGVILLMLGAFVGVFL